jgi:hypothetical protein
MRRSLLAFALTLLVTLPAAAQETGTPVFQAPYRAFQQHEIGLSLSDPGSGLALEGFYKYGTGSNDIGFRVGFWDAGDNRDVTSLLLGADFRSRVFTHNEDFPLDGALTVGIGASISDEFSQGYIPIGLSLGRRIELEDSQTSFVPYLHPVLVPTFGDDSDLLFALGLGVDIKFAPRWDVRVSGALGDYEGISVSFAWLR